MKRQASSSSSSLNLQNYFKKSRKKEICNRQQDNNHRTDTGWGHRQVSSEQKESEEWETFSCGGPTLWSTSPGDSKNLFLVITQKPVSRGQQLWHDPDPDRHNRNQLWLSHPVIQRTVPPLIGYFIKTELCESRGWCYFYTSLSGGATNSPWIGRSGSAADNNRNDKPEPTFHNVYYTYLSQICKPHQPHLPGAAGLMLPCFINPLTSLWRAIVKPQSLEWLIHTATTQHSFSETLSLPLCHSSPLLKQKLHPNYWIPSSVTLYSISICAEKCLEMEFAAMGQYKCVKRFCVQLPRRSQTTNVSN